MKLSILNQILQCSRPRSDGIRKSDDCALKIYLKQIILKVLIWYKRHISRGHNCRFVPSCSEYTYKAVEKYGVVIGLWRGLKRIARCNPLFKGGVDEVN